MFLLYKNTKYKQKNNKNTQTTKEHKENLGEMDVSINLIGVVVSWMYSCVQAHQIVQLNIFVCQVYLNEAVFSPKKVMFSIEGEKFSSVVFQKKTKYFGE